MAGYIFDRVGGKNTDYIIIVDENGAVINSGNPIQAALANVPLADLKPRMSCTRFGYDIALGHISGNTPLFKTGYNPDIDAGAEDLWSAGGLYVFPTTEQRMEIVSSSADDAAAGTGARTVKIWYLDSGFEEHTETVTLDGITPVETDATDIYRINAFRVMTAGDGGYSAGTIDIRHLTDTPIYSRIAIGNNRARTSIYTVPKDKCLYVTQLSFSCGYSTAGRFCEFQFKATYNDFEDAVTDIFYPYYEVGISDGAQLITLDVPIKICAGADIKITATGDAGNANAICTGSYRGWLEAA